MRAILFLLMLLSGGAASFAVTLKLLEEPEFERPVAPVKIDLKFTARDFLQSALVSGWSKPDRWGAWASDPEAVASAQLAGLSRGDLALFIEGRSRSSSA